MCLMSSGMCGVMKSEFKVEVKRKEVIAALLPLQEHWLTLSNLDLLLPALDVGVFFCYKNPTAAAAGSGSHYQHHHDFASMVNVLKKSLAQVLVSYYLFAGELVLNPAGEPELLCNNHGVDFIEAYADVDLCCIDLHNPDATVEGKLVPKKQDGVFSVQATELRCGGIVVGCKFDHRVADAYSTNMFLVAWSEIARLKSTSLIPCLRRSLLNPTRPLRYDPSLDDMYVPLSKLPPPPPARDDDDHLMISRIYYVTAKDLEWLQSQACSSDDDDDDDDDDVDGDGNDNEEYSSNGGCGGYKQQQRRRRRISKLESLSALLWQIIAKSVCDDAGTSKKRCKIGVVVDGRKRLGSCCKAASTNADDEQQQQQQQQQRQDDDPNPMASYFGNVLSIPFGEARAEDLKRRPLSWAAKAVHRFLESAITKEHFLGLIDWVEAHRPEPAVAKIYCNFDKDEDDDDDDDDGHGHGHGGVHADPNPAFVVSSGQRFPVSKVDFGWGKAVFGSYHFPWGGDAGYVMPMPTANGNGDWLVYMHLFRAHLDLLEADALGASIFRPITSDYLLL